MEFKAENDVEKNLIKAQNGEMSPEIFLKELLDLNLFLPVEEDKHQIAGFQNSTSAVPLTVEDEDGKTIVVLFTSPERSKEFIKDYPGFGGGLLADFKWIIEKIGTGVGVIINPGFEVGLELEADALEQLSVH